MSGKGSKPRPINDRQKFSENWDKIFGNKKEDLKNGKKAEKQGK